jgi:hypothetical protein
MSALASTLPQNTGSGYVAAAYIVFFAILLIYVVIMAIRLSRVERSLRELSERAAGGTPTPDGGEPNGAHGQEARERETV